VSDTLDLLTYLIGDLGPGIETPRIGDQVELRLLPSGFAIEAFSAAGQRLGRVPSADRDALTDLLPIRLAPLQGRIDALVPRPRQDGAGRIHIRVSAG
jgi:hypothetical protein